MGILGPSHLPLRLGSTQCFQVSDDVVDLFRCETVFPGGHIGGAAVQNDILESFFLIRRKIIEPTAEIGPERGNATIFTTARTGLGQVAKRTALEKYSCSSGLLLRQFHPARMADGQGL